MKQEDLAKRVGVRRETIGNLEKGRYNPSLVLAWNIAKVFDVSIEEIFTVRGVDRTGSALCKNKTAATEADFGCCRFVASVSDIWVAVPCV